MYALILVGYIVLGGGQNAGATFPSQLIVGNFESEKSCMNALENFDRAKSFKDVTNNMHEYRFGFICAPGGSVTSGGEKN